MDRYLKKNILDLHFHKYLVIASTSIIISFTYLIGVGIAVITKQIKFDNLFFVIILFIFSVMVLGMCAYFLFNSIYHIKNIPIVIKEIKLK